ncbi:MAG: PepSY domain-containing protein [Candidatus Moraniibacteriota bacterium]
MKMHKSIFGLALAVAGVAAVSQAPAVFARQGGSEHGPVATASVAVSQAKAIEIAQGKLAGAMTRAHLDTYNGKATWKIRILSTDGLQRGDFRIDATTGVILNFNIRTIKSHQIDRAAALATKIEKKKLHLAERAHKLELKRNHLDQNGR